MATAQEECIVEEIRWIEFTDEKGDLKRVESPKYVRHACKAYVKIKLHRPICLEKYEQMP